MNQIAIVKKGISANALKWIAVITMMIDHIGAAILEKNGITYTYPNLLLTDRILRYIGRVSFPIFCFLLVEGFLHTRSKWRYLLRILMFAVISEYPFDMAFRGSIDWYHQNVFWTLFLGLSALILIEKVEKAGWQFGKIAGLIIAAAFAAVAQLSHTDYKAAGVLLIYVLYVARDSRMLQCICGAICFIWEKTSVFSFVFIYFYNGIRKKGINKYFFYIFYPAHLLILYAIRCKFF